MHDMSKVFAQRLKDLLDAADEKQVDLARLLNVTEATVSRYLKGRIPDDVRTLSIIADHFQVSVDYLLGRTDNKSGRTSVSKVAERVAEPSPDYDDELIVLFRAKAGKLTPKERKAIKALLEGDDDEATKGQP
ncbi:MAG TPA: helix-turn-helix transcriptional regulator [Symbiobacteriaceae bacterium]|nr:helix-turn-helix transcriptional regulator [Symbiobacteriaceae bacterium]